MREDIELEGRSASDLTPKQLKLLGALLRRPGKLVTKAELMQAGWGDDQVEEGNINFQMVGLRAFLEGVLGESVIETVRGRGFKFIYPVAFGEAHPQNAPGKHIPSNTVSATSSHGSSQSTKVLSPREHCEAGLYQWGAAVADAVRLIGAHDEYFPAHRIRLTLDLQRYVVPESLQRDKEVVIELAMQHSRVANASLHNGRCVRLIDLYSFFPDSREKRHLELRLGMMRWFDYVLANQRFGYDRIADLIRGEHRVSDFIDFGALATERNVDKSTLSNILTAYVTATTTDGFLVYSERSGRVASHPHLLISAVSENLHPRKDGFSALSGSRSLFLAAARGIKEEMSPKLVPKIPTKEIQLIGLHFDLQNYHPGLLFYLPLPMTRALVEQVCRESPGKDFIERGQLRFAPLDNRSGLEKLLMQENWLAAGKASCIRTLEYLGVSPLAQE